MFAMQLSRLNDKKGKKGKVVKPLGRRYYVVESGGQHYIKNRKRLKRSPEAHSPLAEEDSTPSIGSLSNNDGVVYENFA